jgi:hypothetical protein
MNRKNFAWAAAAVLALTGVAAACGGSDGDDSVATASEAARAPSIAEQNAADLATAPEPNLDGNVAALNEVTDQVLYGAEAELEAQAQEYRDSAVAPDPSVGDAIAPDAKYHGDLHRNVEQPSNDGSTSHPVDVPPLAE